MRKIAANIMNPDPRMPDISAAATAERRKAAFLAATAREQDTWLFAYGSLLWDAGFRPAEVRRARLAGWRRSFCILSICYRGSAATPGLVLGLERGGECNGLALRIPAAEKQRIMTRIWDREMITGVYIPLRTGVETPEGEVCCHVFVADPDHPQYAGALTEAQILERVRRARGAAGDNSDYLLNTARRLQRMNIADPALMKLAAELTSGRDDAPETAADAVREGK